MKNGRIENKLYRTDVIEKYHQKCLFLGEGRSISVYSFLNVRLLSTILIFLFVLVIDYRQFVVGLFLAGIYYYSFSKFYFDCRIEKRRRQLEKEAISFFEILMLSLEAGRNLTDSLILSIHSLDCCLSTEFNTALKEVEYGKSLGEALDDLKQRIPSPTIQNMILGLQQSNSYGNNMVKTIHQQIEYIREMRIMEAKERINKMPIQISVVSVVLFVPIILLLILSPAIVQFFLS